MRHTDEFKRTSVYCSIRHLETVNCSRQAKALCESHDKNAEKAKTSAQLKRKTVRQNLFVERCKCGPKGTKSKCVSTTSPQPPITPTTPRPRRVLVYMVLLQCQFG